MARTPLLRAVQGLAQDQRRAEWRGVTTAELREREAEAEYSRGDFLRRSGAAGAAVVLGGTVLARPGRAAGARASPSWVRA